jgi:hypothetical protein
MHIYTCLTPYCVCINVKQFNAHLQVLMSYCIFISVKQFNEYLPSVVAELNLVGVWPFYHMLTLNKQKTEKSYKKTEKSYKKLQT